MADDGNIYGLEDDYATFSKRGERGDHDLWGQHLKNLLDRLEAYAATLVDWEFHSVNGDEIARISVDPSRYPVFDHKGDDQTFYWRSQVGTNKITDQTQRDQIIASRWGGQAVPTTD